MSFGTSSAWPRNSEALFVLMARAGRAIFEQLEATVSAQGESVILFRPLAIVIRFGPQTQQDIAKLTAQHPAGVSRIVDELESRGLVRRMRGEHDRRTIRVEPTEEGRALFAKIDPFVGAALDKVLDPLSPEDREALIRALEKIVSAAGT